MRRAQRAVVGCTLIVVTGCESALQAASQPAEGQFRTDTSVAAYFGVSRTWSDSVWLPMNVATLRGMGEPPLRNAALAPSLRVLRFTWQRSFSPNVAVRVTESPAGCTAVTTVQDQYFFQVGALDSATGMLEAEPAPQATLRRDSTELALSICADLFARLEAIGVSTDRPHSPGGGPDGAHWVFERVDARGHGCLETWSPDSSKSPALWNAGMAFLTAGRARPKSVRETY